MKANGFLSRFLLTFPPLRPDYRPDGDLGEESENFKNMRRIAETFVDFKGVEEPTADGAVVEKSRRCQFDDLVMRTYYDARVELRNKLVESQTNTERSLYSKGDAYLPRLVLLLHVLEKVEQFLFDDNLEAPALDDNDDESKARALQWLGTFTESPISAETFNRGLTLTRWALNETRQVYLQAGIIKPSFLDVVIATLRRTGKPMSSNDIGNSIRALKGDKNKAARDKVLSFGVEKGLICASEIYNEKNHRSVKYYSLIDLEQ